MRQLWTGELGIREALNLIDRLPRHSHLAAAMADDDDLADLIDEDAPAPPPPLTEWSADHGLLTIIAERLGDLLAATAQANSGKKVPSPRPLPRPETALKRKVKRRREYKRELIRDRLAKAKAAGRPTMSDLAADPMHALTAPRRRDGR
ncbi:hypothetical protein AB0K34_04880 [Actinomadura sp. NPDC049382]|uniref:hypothetical protein n=1 Tax=Actinomadura sp. NPDC049382 TaxID=3158220 RepID=UPI0034213F73